MATGAHVHRTVADVFNILWMMGSLRRQFARETVVLDQLEGAVVQPLDRCHPRDPLDAQWAEVLGRDFRAEGVHTLRVRPFQVLPLEVRQNWHLVRCTESTHWS